MTQQDINLNRTRIFRLLFEGGAFSRNKIAKQLDLSLPTVTKNLDTLIDNGLVCKSGSIGKTGGRRAATYSCVANARTAIGLDITRHHVTAVVVDLRGSIIGMVREKIDYERTDAFSRKIGDVVEKVIALYDIDRSKVLGVGIGVPGLTTKDNRKIFYGEILRFTGATVEEFSKYIEFPTLLYNDAKAACFAETWRDQDMSNTFYIMLSNNVGGAAKINNTIYLGDNLHGCEIGHINIHNEGKRCYCGQKGCVDSYCSASVLYSKSDGSLKRFFELLDDGDEAASACWETYTEDLALAVKSVRMLFDCRIVLGGYVGGFMDKYIDDIKKKVAKITTFDKDAEYLEVCKYKTESIAAGASLNFIYKFVFSI